MNPTNMTNERLCVLAQKGDEGAREFLVEKNMGFIVQTADLIYRSSSLEGSDLSVYEVGRVFKEDERILEAYNMTLEAITTKLMWVLGCTDDRKRQKELFYKEINFDIYR